MKLLEIITYRGLETAEQLLSILQKAYRTKKLWFMDSDTNMYPVVDVTKLRGRKDRDAFYVAVKLSVLPGNKTSSIRLIRMDALPKFWELKKDDDIGGPRLVLRKKTGLRR